MPPKTPAAKRPKSGMKGVPEEGATPDPPTSFPLWDETDIANERWADTGGAKKDKCKWPFEDPYGQVPLPPSLAQRVALWKRPGEDDDAADAEAPPEHRVVSGNRFEKVLQQREPSEVERLWMRKKHMKLAEVMQEPLVSLVFPNEHLLDSELMRELIVQLSSLQRPGGGYEPHTTRPWQHIYPQGRDGLPTYNPGGKYCVKLFCQGAWRKVTVDDLLPYDSQGLCLLPDSGLDNELWPAIIAKAICRVASLTYDMTPGHLEHGETSVAELLCGWRRQTIPVLQSDPAALTEVLFKMGEQPPTDDFERKDAAVEDGEGAGGASAAGAAGEGGATAAGGGAEDKAAAVANSKDGKRPKKAGKAAAPEAERAGKERPPTEASSRRNNKTAVPPPVPDEPPVEPVEEAPVTNDRVLLTAEYRNCGARGAAVGLPVERAHAVRVLSCIHIPSRITPRAAAVQGLADPHDHIDFAQPSDFVLQMESPLAVYTGALGYGGGGWTPRIQVALETGQEREDAMLAHTQALHAARQPHHPFRWFIRLTDFLALFDCIHVHHKSEPYDLSLTVMGKGLHTQPVVVDQDNLAAAQPSDTALPEPFMLHIDSLTPSKLLLTFSTSPVKVPFYPELQPKGAAVSPPTPASPAPSATEPAKDKKDKGDKKDGKELKLVVPEPSANGDSQKSPSKPPHYPEKSSMTLLALDWRTPADDNVVAVMETTASTTLLLELPSGRHVFRLMVDAPSDWSFTASCAKEFDLGPASEIFEILGGHCAEMQKHAVTAVQALGLCLTKDLGVVKDIIAKLAQTHGVAYDVPLPMMTAVWHALLWSLEHVLVDDWTEEETVTTESVDAEGNTVKLQEKRTVLSGLGKAWTRVVKYLERELIVQYRLAMRQTKNAGAESPTQNEQDPIDEESAANTIQRSARLFLAQKRTNILRDDRWEQDQLDVRESWNNISQNLLDFGLLVFNRLFEIAPESAPLFPFAKAETLHGIFSRYEGTIPDKNAGDWVVLFQDTLTFQQPTHVAVELRTPSEKSAQGGALMPSPFQTIIYDNDTQQALPSTFGRPCPHFFQPNKRGYTLVAHGRLRSSQLGQLPWQFDIMSSLPLTWSEDHRLSNELVVAEQKGACETDKDDILFRYFLRPERPLQHFSIDCGLPGAELPEATLDVEICRDGELLAKRSGRANVLFTLLTLELVPGVTESAELEQALMKEVEAQAPSNSKDKDKKDKDSGREKSAKKDRAPTVVPPAADDASKAAASAAPPVAIPPRHVYTITAWARGLSVVREAAEVDRKKGSANAKRSKSVAPKKGPEWHLRVHSQFPCKLEVNKQREDEIKSIKLGWEAMEHGRARKAQDLRKKYLEQSAKAAKSEAAAGAAAAANSDASDAAASAGENGEAGSPPADAPQAAEQENEEPLSATASVTSVIRSSDSLQVMDDVLKAARESSHELKLKTFKAQRESTKAKRSQELELCNSQKIAQVASLSSLRQACSASKTPVLTQRQAYRQKLVDAAEAEAKKAAEEAARAQAELNAQQEATPSKSAKGKKKK